MKVAHILFKFINRVFPVKVAFAHCDIPCAIYLPQPSKTAAETVEKMVQKLNELTPPAQDADRQAWLEFENASTRYVQVKEEHAQICKQELLILWTDYFKDEHLDVFRDLHDKFWRATKLCSKNKREVNLEAAANLRVAVDEIAEMFEKAEESK